MLHDVTMTEQGGAWERLDTAAVTPRSASAPHGERVSRIPALRLKRRRSPVIASLDGGGGVFQRRLRDVLVGSATILVPVVGLNIWVTVVAYDRLDPNDAGLPSFFTGDTGSGIEDVGVWMAAVFVSLATAVVGYFCAQILIGERFRTPVSLGRGLLRTLKKLPLIFAAWILTHWWSPLLALVVVTAESDDVGVLLFFLAFVSWFASAATLLVIPAMVGERLGPFAAAKRNWRLIRLRYGLCLVFVLAATLLSVLLLIGIATLVPILEQLGFLDFGGATWIVQGVMLQLSVLVVVPLVALATAQAYVEVRIVGEGLDLVVDSDAAFGPRGSEPSVAESRFGSAGNR